MTDGLQVLLGLATVAGALLLEVSLAALLRRLSVPYVFVTFVFAALLGRTVWAASG